MGFYTTKRLLLMIPLFIGITIISLAVIHLAPGSPIDMATDLNPKATDEVKERMRALYFPFSAQIWDRISHLILRNALAPVLVSAKLGVAGAIFTESALSFLGIGAQSPTASWGRYPDCGKRQYRLVTMPVSGDGDIYYCLGL